MSGENVEAKCQRCGGNNSSSWFVDSDRYNAACAALDVSTVSIICPGCFVEGHEQASGMRTTWALTPATPFVWRESTP